MKLKPIPNNIVVHTPTEAEAKELLAILHENGWKWITNEPLINYYPSFYFVLYKEYDNVARCDYNVAKSYSTILTLSEFKKRYCEEDKSQPKFKVGDIMRVTDAEHPLYNKQVKLDTWIDGGNYWLTINMSCGLNEFRESDLEPYPEPETKPTEDMETKGKESGETGNNPENSQLNLCELLKGHEGEYFYSPYLGNCVVTEIKPYESHNQIWLRTDEDIWCAIPSCGHEPDGAVMLFPSRALYEQYPLDAAKAWRIWDEKHYIHRLAVRLYSDDEIKKVLAAEGKENVSGLLSCICRFKTLADRDKCVEEIKAVIEKYNK